MFGNSSVDSSDHDIFQNKILDSTTHFNKRSVNKCTQEMGESLPEQFRDDALLLSSQQPADGLRQTTAYDLSDLPGWPDKQAVQRAALKLLP